MNLEQQINALDIEDERVEAEPLIDRCFEIGFFPWDNPKFLVFLHHAIRVNIALPRGNFMRGLIYARHVEKIMPTDADKEIHGDICSWANLVCIEGASSAFPHVSDQHLFWLRFWRQSDRQAWLPISLRLKLAGLRSRLKPE